MARRPSWRARLAKAKPAHVVQLAKPFAGVPAGTALLIPSPVLVAGYLAAIPSGETRTPEAMRADLARAAGTAAACPVATAHALRLVAEAALEDLRDGRPRGEVAPFWRVVAPGTKLAARLSCGAEALAGHRALDGA